MQDLCCQANCRHLATTGGSRNSLETLSSLATVPIGADSSKQIMPPAGHLYLAGQHRLAVEPVLQDALVCFWERSLQLSALYLASARQRALADRS
jgi:hypothetical protein